MALNIGEKAPDFTLPSTSGRSFALNEDAANKPVILYFYPKDFTPGCTREACSFRDNIEDFKEFDIDVYGISTDTIEQHIRFKAKHDLPVDLLSDMDGYVSKKYQARLPFMNISKRITYLLDKDHRIAAVYTNLFGAEKHIHEMIRQLKAETV